MIQAYLKDNKDYQNNGDMVLFPESCTVSAQLNGTWTLELSHPLDEDGRWKYIEEEGIIAVPTFMGEKQLFRVSEISKEEDGITATCYPIFFDSADDCFLNDVRPTIKNGQEALDIMMADSQYSGESNIRTANTAYFVRRNLMEAISGQDEPTFLGRWGGEILYDNYKIIINERVGGDYGVEARYGKNIIGIEYQLDMSSVATRIIPVSYNGYTIGGNNGHVDSPLIGKYAKKYIREMVFEDVKMREDASEDDEENGVIVCDTQAELDAALTKKCQEQFALGVDLPAVSMSIDMELLSRTEEYKDYVLLETVGLGDTVSCIHEKLGISTQARVVSIEWDCIKDKPEKIELGAFKYDYFKDIQSAFSGMQSAMEAVQQAFGPDGFVMAERVKGVLNAINVQLKYQKDVAQKQDVRAILFEDLDPDSPTYGAMCLGAQGFQIANKRTADGRDWEWTTAFTAAGGYANAIITGLLSDKAGRNFWNLDTGDFRMSANTTFDGKTVDELAGEAADGALTDAKSYVDTEIDNFVSKTYDPKIAELQKQLDGQIETFYNDYEPTLQNEPASGWTSDALKARHEGDLFFWKSKGYAYRFLKDGNSWKWQPVQDTDITKALAQAAAAQDTADGKRRTFLAQPVPPYDEGDLWYGGTDKDVLVCKKTRESGSYQTSDWGKADRYIDQVAADKAASDAVAAQTQLDIFNKLTNNGELKGLFMKDNQLYINGTYISTETLSAICANLGTITAGILQAANYAYTSGNFSTAGILINLATGLIRSKQFAIDAYGNAYFSGALNAATGTFSGELKAAKGSFAGNLEAATGTFTGTLLAGYVEGGSVTGVTLRAFRFYLSDEVESSPAYRQVLSIKKYASGGDLEIGYSDLRNWIVGTSSAFRHDVNISGSLQVDSGATISGGLTTYGGKSRAVKTPDYSERLLYCYEMPTPFFGDIGEAVTDENGECYIYLDDVFSETVSAQMEYQVFLQKEGPGDVWIESKDPAFFVVKGTPGLKFAWEVKVVQRDYELERLEPFEKEQDEDVINYEFEYEEEIKSLIAEREGMYYEAA